MPFPKVRELFERMRDDGKRIALASSGNETEVEHYVKLAEIGELIESADVEERCRALEAEPGCFRERAEPAARAAAGRDRDRRYAL